jgi:hypothetical protein
VHDAADDDHAVFLIATDDNDDADEPSRPIPRCP